jgi:hypothetical protein
MCRYPLVKNGNTRQPAAVITGEQAKALIRAQELGNLGNGRVNKSTGNQAVLEVYLA